MNVTTWTYTERKIVLARGRIYLKGILMSYETEGGREKCARQIQ